MLSRFEREQKQARRQQAERIAFESYAQNVHANNVA